MAKTKWKECAMATEKRNVAPLLWLFRFSDGGPKQYLLKDKGTGDLIRLTPKRAQAIVDVLTEEGLAQKPKPIVLSPKSKSQERRFSALREEG